MQVSEEIEEAARELHRMMCRGLGFKQEKIDDYWLRCDRDAFRRACSKRAAIKATP